MTAKLISTNKDEHYVTITGKRKPAELMEILSQFPPHLDIKITVDYEDSLSFYGDGAVTTFYASEFKD